MTGSHFEQFDQLKKRVVRFAERLSALARDGRSEEAVRVLDEFMGRFISNRFLVLVVGDFKSGKSTLVNALVGKAVCPVKATPRTAKVTRLAATAKSDEPETVEILFKEDRPKEVRRLDEGPIDELVAVDGKRTANVELVDVFVSAGTSILRNPIRLVDTPGLGSGESEHSKLTREYLRHADAVLFVFSGTKPYSETERDFLLTFRSLLDRTVFAVNRADDLSAEDRKDVVTHIQSSLLRDILEKGAAPPAVHPVSATKAFAATKAEAPEDLLASGLPAIVDAVEEKVAGGLALRLLGDIVRQQAEIGEGLSDRARLSLDALVASSESVRAQKPLVADLQRELKTLARRSSSVEATAWQASERFLEWAPQRVQALRNDIVDSTRAWVQQCPSEEACKKQLPGVVAKLLADALDNVDRELVVHLGEVQRDTDEGLTQLFDEMESRTRAVLVANQRSADSRRGGLGRGAVALSRLAAMADGVGGPTEGYGLASAALTSALAPSPTVRFLSVTAAVSLLLATLGGPVGWLVAGVASLIAAIAGYDHATTWRDRVLKHMVKGFDEQVVPRTEQTVEESIHSFFATLVSDVEQRAATFLEELQSIVGEFERELEREGRSRTLEADRLREHLKHLERLRAELSEFSESFSSVPPSGPKAEASA